MAPIVQVVRESAEFTPVLVSTGQHRELLEDALRPFGLIPDHKLDVMYPGQTANHVLARVIDGMSALLTTINPAALLVQGDTTSALASALASYNMHIPVGHVEAGLRTYDHEHPFPEESNRQLIDRLATWCFAPTHSARANLLREHIDAERVFLTGNTVVDALLWAFERQSYQCLPNTILLTLHRRESFGLPLREILLGLGDFLDVTPHARVLWPIHPNPEVSVPVEVVKRHSERVSIVAPMDYLQFTGALATCRLVLTDSGGVQEEAPSFRKFVLVTREKTERSEACEEGLTRLVGRDRGGIRDALVAAWSEPTFVGAIPAPNPFGDGEAAERIVGILATAFGHKHVSRKRRRTGDLQLLKGLP